MEKKLGNKVVLITGGPQGIGEAIARRVASEGAAVAPACSRNGAAAARVVDDIAEAGGTAAAFKADCADVGATERLIRDAAMTGPPRPATRADRS